MTPEVSSNSRPHTRACPPLLHPFLLCKQHCILEPACTPLNLSVSSPVKWGRELPCPSGLMGLDQLPQVRCPQRPQNMVRHRHHHHDVLHLHLHVPAPKECI